MTTTDTRPASNAEQTQRECPDHWHHDADHAGHTCHAPDRDRRCPTCGADPQYRGRAFIAARLDEAGESVAMVTHHAPLTALNTVLRVHRPTRIAVTPDDVETMCAECYETVDDTDPMCRSLRAVATAWHEHPDFDRTWWL